MVNWKGFKDYQTTIEIDLDKTQGEILNSFHKDVRYCIRKAQEHNLTFEVSNDWDSFYPIYEQIMKQGGVEPRTLKQLKYRNDLQLFLIRLGDELIGGMAGAIAPRDKTIFGLSLAAMDHRYNYMNTNYFAYWSLIKWCKQKGFNKFDMGGFQESAVGKLRDINKFKKKWNTTTIKYPIYSKNPVRIYGRKMTRMLNAQKQRNVKDEK